jgi:methyl-accepting chemotaxis protein
VVASEVKSLAVQTAKATGQIAGQIEAVQNSTRVAVDAIRRNTGRMREIDGYTSAVALSLQQQDSATDEISHNVASAAHGAKGMVTVLDEVTPLAARQARCLKPRKQSKLRPKGCSAALKVFWAASPYDCR